MIQQIDRRDLVYGSVLGLAVGNALGAGAQPRKGVERPGQVSDITGGGIYDLKPGEWTAEVSMAMCLAESLLACSGFDASDQWRRYRECFEHGTWSCRDFCFGMEPQMRYALQANARGVPVPEDVSMTEHAGFLVRLAPVALYFLQDAESVVLHAAGSAQMTHPIRLCVDAARYFAALLHGALTGMDKERMLAADYAPPGVDWSSAPLAPEIESLRLGRYQSKPAFTLDAPEDLPTVLQAALWAFAHASHFKDGALRAVNLGGKAATVGAIYGQLAGAYYGAEHMPDNWLRILAHREALERVAKRLWRASLL